MTHNPHWEPEWLAQARANMEYERRRIVEGYWRLRKRCDILKDGAYRFEGKRWEFTDEMAVRKAEGWELRVYRVEDDVIEVCLIDPNGNSKTYA